MCIRDRVQAILDVLHRRFPHIENPAKEDICYATTNRQAAVQELAQRADMVVVVGSHTSSNSNRLREVAETCGTPAVLIMSPEQVDPSWPLDHRTIGVTSGASTPETLVEEIVGALLRASPEAQVEVVETVKESVEFRPSRDLVRLAMSATTTQT